MKEKEHRCVAFILDGDISTDVSLGFPSGGLFVSEAAKDFLLATFTSIGTTEVQEMVEQFDKQIISAESNLMMISNGSTGFPITRQAIIQPLSNFVAGISDSSASAHKLTKS